MDQSANHVLFRGSRPGAADRMRDLLARTVQDHVSDQRSHASALEKIRKHLEGLEWLVKEVRQHELTDLSGQLAAQTQGLLRQLAEARENLPAWAESLPEHIRALSAQVRPVAGLPALRADLGMVSENVDQVLPRLQALCDMIAQAKETVQAQEERLAKLEQNDLRLQQTMESAAGRFSRLDKAMAELSQRAGYRDKEMSALKGRIDQGFAAQTARLEQSVAALSGTLDEGLDDKLGALDAKLSGTDGKVGALVNRIDRLDDRIGDTDDRIGFINERIASIDDRIGALDGRMDDLDGRLEGVGGRIEGVSAKFEAVDGRMETLGGYFAGVDGRIMALGDHLMAFGERLNGVHQVTARLSTLDERLSDALTPLTDELRLRSGHAEVEEVVAKVVSAAQAEMTARLDSLEQTVLTLAEAMLRPVRHIADQRREGERS